MGDQISRAAHSLWAKKDNSRGKLFWLPLMIHLQDTMNVAGFLWNHWLSSGQRDGIISQIQNGNETIAERLVLFLGGVHDIGKATPAFQTQKGFFYSEDLNSELINKLEQAGFTGICDFDTRSCHFSHHSLAGEVILQNFGVNKGIASIIGAHHGKPVDSEWTCEVQSTSYKENYRQNDKNPQIARLWQNTQGYIFEWALKQSEFYQKESLPEISKPAQVLLSGLVIMADWIASNENYFPLIPLEKESAGDMQQRFQNGIRKWYRDQPFELQEPSSPEKLYTERFEFLPRDFQKVIFDTVQAISEPGIVIIEAPTGCGKTEAALATAEQLAAKTSRSGLFFGLPTQATSNGMFPRIFNWLKHISTEYGVASIRLQHGKAALNPLMNQLAAHVDEDEDTENTVIVNQWFSGRKTAALDDFVIGTVDQFLLASLKQKHLALRHLGFDKKVVIIDEVHAYDAYMQQYLERSIRWMGAYGTPVILLSATLPAEKRQEFAMAYLQGAGIKKRDIVIKQADLKTRQYPLITYSDGLEIRQNADFPAKKDKTVLIQKLEDDRLYSVVSDLIRDGGVVGIIVNTVRKSQEIARKCGELFGSENTILLHSNFIATDRIEKEEQLMKKIGKNAVRPEKLIVVGTQVIEQSLDIDFDVLITDLCPMDLLIQRIGRLHRHEISRPQKHQKAVVYLLGTNDSLEFDQGSARVYGEYLLARTQYYLPQKILIPSSISDLVQEVYDFDGTDPHYQGDQLQKYEKWKEEFTVQIENKKQKAEQFQIDKPVRKINTDRYNLIGWLETPDESTSDEEAYAQVRDTRETVEIIAIRRYGEKYGFFKSHTEWEREVSDHIEEPEIAQKLASQTLRLPYSLIRRKGISHLIQWLENYNKKYLSIWQSQSWLKGSLGLIFDENGDFYMDDSDIVLHYDYQYGLELKREGEQ
ncbi:MAG: CRISPR-associated helicase Cas3' [Lachnospiraceae bacterium]|jgi:CRISPR-associated endonuclease/helicase Cas3